MTGSSTGYLENNGGTNTIVFTGSNPITYTGGSTSTGLVYTHTGTLSLSSTLTTTLASIGSTAAGYTFYQDGGVFNASCSSGSVANANSNSTGMVFFQAGGSATTTGVYNITTNSSSYGGRTNGGGWTHNGNIVWPTGNTSSGIIAPGGGFTLNGLPLITGAASAWNGGANHAPLYSSGGPITWTGTLSNSSGSICLIQLYSNAISLSGLSLSNSGSVVIHNANTATLSQSGGVITNATTAAQAIGLGCSLAVTGPTLPAVGNVINGTSYGYSGALSSGTLTLVDPGVSYVLSPASGGPASYSMGSGSLIGTAKLPGNVSSGTTGLTLAVAGSYGVGGHSVLGTSATGGGTLITSDGTLTGITTTTLTGGTGANNLTITNGTAASGTLYVGNLTNSNVVNGGTATIGTTSLSGTVGSTWTMSGADLWTGKTGGGPNAATVSGSLSITGSQLISGVTVHGTSGNAIYLTGNTPSLGNVTSNAGSFSLTTPAGTTVFSGTGLFQIGGLGISGTNASNVSYGTMFGPSNAWKGQAPIIPPVYMASPRMIHGGEPWQDETVIQLPDGITITRRQRK